VYIIVINTPQSIHTPPDSLLPAKGVDDFGINEFF
jgi:hypothetical protein